jgi:hypothetical protein
MKKTLPYFYGFLWFFGGYSLLNKGITLLFGFQNPFLLPFGKSIDLTIEISALLLLLVGIAIGIAKSTFVLSKVAERIIHRADQAKTFREAVDIRSIVLMVFMIFLGISLKYFPIPSDVLGCIDIAVAAALLQTSLLFFKKGRGQKQEAQ